MIDQPDTQKSREGASSQSFAAPCSLSSESPEEPCNSTTHYAGCACHEKGWENKWKCAVEMAARAQVERDHWKMNHDHQVEMKRIIKTRPDLAERAPMVEKMMEEKRTAETLNVALHLRIRQLERAIRFTERQVNSDDPEAMMDAIRRAVKLLPENDLGDVTPACAPK